MIVAVVLCIVCAIAIDYLAIVDKGAAKTKVILGMLLLTSGDSKIFVLYILATTEYLVLLLTNPIDQPT